MVWLMERLATMLRMKGFGFIEFETAEAAAKCLYVPRRRAILSTTRG